MKFSVLMSVYYKEKPEYLNMALGSMVNQTLMPDEIVLVKDGPLTPELEAVIDSYLQSINGNIFKIVPLETNVGLGLALNRGLVECSYAMVARMDSDDICEPNRFRRQIDYILSSPGVDVVGSSITEYDEDMESLLSVRAVPQQHTQIIERMKKRNPLNHVTIMYNKQMVIDCGSYENCPYFEDYYLWCKLAVNGAVFHNLSESLVRVRSGSSMIDRRGGIKYVVISLNFKERY